MKFGITLSILALSAAVSVSASDLQLTAGQWKQSRPKNVRFEAADRSVRLENGAAVSRVLDLESGAKYKLTFQVKGEGIEAGEKRGARIVLNAGKRWERITSRLGNGPETGSFGWRSGAGIINTANVPDSRIRLELSLMGQGKVWYKDLKIEKLPSVLQSEEELAEALKLDHQLAGWEISALKNIAVEEPSETGEVSVRLENGASIGKTLELEPDTKYELSFLVKGEDIRDGKNLGARIMLNAGKRWERITSLPGNKPETGTFDWRQGSGIIDTAKFPDSRIRLMLNLTGQGKVWFKDLKIAKKK